MKSNEMSRHGSEIIPYDIGKEAVEQSRLLSPATRILMGKILSEGEIFEKDFGRGAELVLDVAGFYNQSVSPDLMKMMAESLWEKLSAKGARPTKILTAAASGIPLSTMLGSVIGEESDSEVMVVVAKKGNNAVLEKRHSISATAMSYTGGNKVELFMAGDAIGSSDRVLIVDDFLATGSIMSALAAMVSKSGACFEGIAVGVEKTYMSGSREVWKILEKHNLDGGRLANVVSVTGMRKDAIQFGEMGGEWFELKTGR